MINNGVDAFVNKLLSNIDVPEQVRIEGGTHRLLNTDDCDQADEQPDSGGWQNAKSRCVGCMIVGTIRKIRHGRSKRHTSGDIGLLSSQLQ